MKSEKEIKKKIAELKRTARNNPEWAACVSLDEQIKLLEWVLEEE